MITAVYTQKARNLSVHTPLGPDVLLLVGLSGEEGLSRLFRWQLDLIVDNRKDAEVQFDKLLGQPVRVELSQPGQGKRYYCGIVSRFAQGGRDAHFTTYRMEVVPQLWLLTQRVQSRIFQQKTVPEILREVLAGLDCKMEIDTEFHPRDFCVQYNETDFAFVSRLMEEEGIYYFFRHTAEGHQLVLADSPGRHPELPGAKTLVYQPWDQPGQTDNRVYEWCKYQELRPGKVTLWDHCFELPHKHLEADQTIQNTVLMGRVMHKLNAGPTMKQEVYEYPGEYARRFDGLTPGGGDRKSDLQKLTVDNKRTAKIRMQQQAVGCLEVEACCEAAWMTSGHRFNLTRHFNADGTYVVTSVTHDLKYDRANYRSGGAGPGMTYTNKFRCIPIELPFRPQRVTPKPRIYGTQTAVVVGPAGEEIFTDKYGRVKVQFHWDRQGKNDATSSCWIRVSQVHAGKRFGAIDIPRVGEEVIVGFTEGDPDEPIVIGRVYNAREMPPTNLPAEKVISGMKSNTYPGGGGFNQITMNDTKGKELMFLNAQYDMTGNVNNNRTMTIGVDSSETIGNNSTLKVGNDESNDIGNNLTTVVGNNIMVTAGTSIVFKCGASMITMNQAGMITISGTVIAIAGQANCTMTAPVTNVTGGVLLTAMGAVTRVQGFKLAQVIGDRTDVEASAELSLKGTPIKLN